MGRLFWTAMVAAMFMMVVAIWNAVSTVDWPPDGRDIVPGTFGLFAIFAFIGFFSLLYENLALKTPRLKLVFDPTKDPYVQDKLGKGGDIRIYRVGIVNAGASADVRVKLNYVTPTEKGATYVGHELAPMGQPFDTMSATIHRSKVPVVFFDVVGQICPQSGTSHSLHIRYAAKGLYFRPLSGQTEYRLGVVIDGPGAPDAAVFIVSKPPGGAVWNMRRW